MDEQERELRERELRQQEFAERFGAALETWRFEVNSYWNRTSYFALFQGGAFAAEWKVLSEKHAAPAVALAILGLGLTWIWFVNNVRMHEYVEYWWDRAAGIEKEFEVSIARQLVSDYDARRKYRHSTRYSAWVRAVPVLFGIGWLWMAFWSALCLLNQMGVHPCL